MPLAAAKAAAKAVVVRLTQASQIKTYLDGADRPRLNIGCGYNKIPGWLNADLEGGRGGSVFMDATKTFPIPDDTLAAVLCEHMIEHVPQDAAITIIRESFRVLAPGGRIRIITPDLETLAAICVSPPTPESQKYLDFVAALHKRPSITPADALNYIFYDYGHRHIYTPKGLAKILADAGFVDIVEGRGGAPVNEIFQGAEGHPNWMGLDMDALEAFALEARKPGGA